jgi:Zn-dependent protease with chaperone function
MIAAAALLGWAVLLLAGGAPALARAAWPDRAPRLAIIAWLALAGSASASVVLGGAALVVPAAQVSDGLARLLAACAMELQADYAHPGGAVLTVAGAALAAAVTARLAWCTAAELLARGRAGRSHSRSLRLVGRADQRLGAIVVDHHSPAVYCLPGPRRPVVLTTAAVQALDSTQLAAVLAHEKAHQSGHHHLLVVLAAIPAAAFPPVQAFQLARDQVARLAELAADDNAAVASPRLAVAGALLALAAAPVGAAALGAGGATAARIHRMIAAPNPLTRAAVATWTLAVAALIALPLLLLASPAIAALAHCCYLYQ